MHLKLDFSKEKVAECISNYKRQVWALLKLNKFISFARKRIIDDSKVEEIKEYWQRNSHKPLRLCGIKSGIWEKEEKMPCNSTLAQTLKEKLNMSYRVLSIRPPKTRTHEHLRSYCESVMTQCILYERGFECIYIDEFHISGHRSKVKGWSFKDEKSAIISTIDSFSMYFTLAVSEKHIYGIMANEKAFTAKIFIHFLDKLLELKNKITKESENRTCFIIDNVSIHKTVEVKEFAKKRWIHMITISSYSPALNGAETIIQAIKSKIKQRRSQGR